MCSKLKPLLRGWARAHATGVVRRLHADI
jgi:hypothetical protein